METKNSFAIAELAELLDTDESRIDHRLVPILRSLLGDILGETVRTFVDQGSRIERIEARLETLLVRVASLERALYPPLENEAGRSAAPAEAPLVDLESVLGIEIDADADSPPLTGSRPLVEIIVALRQEGLGYADIARSLARQGVPTRSGKGSWTAQKVRRMVPDR